jgi:Tol biopolymer transport system component
VSSRPGDTGSGGLDDPLLRLVAHSPELPLLRAAEPVSPGGRIGPYTVVEAIGAGAMGTVYRVHDERLGRDVALKVLPAGVVLTAERLQRFEQEARAAAMLNHPNILAVHDIGRHGDLPYVVFELLEGTTLRGLLDKGTMPARRAIALGAQLARGLAAAHEKGIVHRDLKPENVFVTRDGQVKILDFGLAKLTTPEGGISMATMPGTVLGTAGYMSPEQVRGEELDHRSDLFSLGAILFELFSGERAFLGPSAAEAMSAILREEPAELASRVPVLGPALDHIVRHCLEKAREHRFQSARDLALALEALASGRSSTALPRLALSAPARRRGRWAAVLSLALAVGAGGALALSRWMASDDDARARAGTARASPATRAGTASAEGDDARDPNFERITFRRGEIRSARFAPDGRTILYSAAWDGRPLEVFTTRRGGVEARALGQSGILFGVSSREELALNTAFTLGTGTLARVAFSGGAPRAVLTDVQSADWSPDGESLAVTRLAGWKVRLEYPIGTTLVESNGGLGHARVSPRGELVAFLEYPMARDDRGAIAVVDRAGNKRTLSRVFNSIHGIAWSKDGREIWFTAGDRGAARALWAVNLHGRERLVLRIPGTLTLHDVSPKGEVLLAVESGRIGISGLAPGEERERDLSWFDLSVVADLTANGRQVLITESGDGAGPSYLTYLRPTGGGPAVRLSEGAGAALSPDGAFALVIPVKDEVALQLVPTGAGAAGVARTLSRHGIANWGDARFVPDGQSIVVGGARAGEESKLFLIPLGGGEPRALTPGGVRSSQFAVSHDGRHVATIQRDKTLWLYPLGSGEPRRAPAIPARHVPAAFTPDDRGLYLYRYGGAPSVEIVAFDLETGAVRPHRRAGPADPAGVSAIWRLTLSADGRAHAYSYTRVLSDLYVVDGLR